MSQERMLSWILRIEAAGFAALGVLIWMNEYWDLPHVLFSARAAAPQLYEAVIESVVVTAIGALIVAGTSRAFDRLAYAQSRLTMCGACRRVSVNGRWMRFEEFILRRDNRDTSHGLCPDCFAAESAKVDLEGAAS